jgi:hypothetical protein
LKIKIYGQSVGWSINSITLNIMDHGKQVYLG